MQGKKPPAVSVIQDNEENKRVPSSDLDLKIQKRELVFFLYGRRRRAARYSDVEVPSVTKFHV